MNERIKELRKSIGLTQQEFANRLHIKRNTVATYETGKSKPSDAAVILICREFNVNEKWLRTGEEPMFIEPTSFDLNEFAINNGATELELNFLKAYFGLPPEVRKKLVAYFKNSVTDDTSEVSVDIKPTDIPSTLNVNDITKLDAKEVAAYPEGDIDIDAEVAEYRQELEIQKKARESSSVSDGSNSGTARMV